MIFCYQSVKEAVDLSVALIDSLVSGANLDIILLLMLDQPVNGFLIALSFSEIWAR